MNALLPARLRGLLSSILCMIALSAPARSTAGETQQPEVGIFCDLIGPDMKAVVAGLEGDLAAIGFRVTRIYAKDLLSPLSCDLLVYPAGARYPAGAEDVVRAYLRKGGRLVVLGGPAFTQPAWNLGGAWKTWDDLKVSVDNVAEERPALSFDLPENAAGWVRATNAPESAGRATVGDYGSSHGHSLQVDIENLTGWDNWGHSVLGWPAGKNLVTFRARGDRNTRQVMVELREADGSRWIAVTPIGTDWRFYTMAQEDFHYWQDSASSGRGGPGNHVHLDNVRMVSLGLAFSHTPMPGGRHRFWIGSLAVQPDPRIAGGAVAQPLVLDSLTPAYKYFPVHEPRTASAAASPLIEAGSYPVPSSLVSVSPRPQGTGFGMGRTARFIPLILAGNMAGRRSGYVAWLQVNTGGPLAGSAWAVFGANDAGFYAHPKVQRAIVRLVSVMSVQPFLAEGGAHVFACPSSDRDVLLGARVLPTRRLGGTAALVRIIVSADGRAAPFFAHIWAVAPSDRQAEISAHWKPATADWARGLFTVRTELLLNGKVVDTLSHPLTVWRPKPTVQREWVTSHDGSFWLRGRRWAPHSVNYMPSSGIALEDQEAFEQWLGARAYDPEVIEEDLTRIAGMGFNSVSVFLYRSSMETRNLFDFLARAQRHGLKVNLSLRPHADPFDFNRDEVRDMITFCRLAENDTVFAYDLAWERGFGNYEPSYSNTKGRKGYDAQWKAWVVDRYGSIVSAETDWGFAIPYRDGEAAGPSDEMLDRDGPWKRMVAAYRRFVDDLASRAYGRVARLIRSVDPHHLVSFRMTIAGDPTAPPHEFPFDFRGLGRALDIMEPEGYGRIGEWNRVRDGVFTTAYSRYAAPGRPVYWAEFGTSTWSGSNFLQPNPGQDNEASFYANFYRMVEISASNGTSAWWYPGGFRLNENSDFGIVNPDGSDRPVTRVIRERVRGLRKSGEKPPPSVDTWIDVDRDADVRGLAGIYAKSRTAFWLAVDAGRHPGLRDRGTGATSVTAPLIAVGGSPYTGKNPPRYLNAEFDRIEVQAVGGRWVDVTGPILKGGEAAVEVAAGRPVRARAVVGNTESARWVAPKRDRNGAPILTTGVVALATTPDSEIQMRSPVGVFAGTPTLGTALVPMFILSSGITKETRVVLQMTAWKRMWFGEKVAFHLRPRQ